MNIHFLSFADKRFHKSLKRIKSQAQAFGIFEKIHSYNENNLSASFKDWASAFIYPDTFYLCAWKPQVVLQVLEEMEEGDIVLYADVGCHLNKKGLDRFEEYIELVANSKSGILTSTFDASMPEKHWTKGDTFDYFLQRNNASITETAHLQATSFFVQKRASTIVFLKEWLAVFKDKPELAIRDSGMSNNLDGFIEHRSDQSFFSVLGKLNKIETISADELQGSTNWDTNMIKFPIWAKRDRIMDDGFWIQPTAGRALLLLRRKIRKLFSKA